MPADEPATPLSSRSKAMCCTFWGWILPAWLPYANAPECSLLIHHLGIWHRDEAQAYRRRLAVEDFETVLMEVFEQVDDATSMAELIRWMTPEALQAAFDEAVSPYGANGVG
jgi:hypothetical protein